jgi:putative protein-disulfide isomerase
MHLIYIGDPMCSWCYGFGKELAVVLSEMPSLPLQIVVGGVRAGATDVLDDAGKQFRLSHWARVEAASKLPFNREALMARKGFVYDTEPICRAVVAARIIAPDVPLLEIFRSLQHAFYVDGLDTTDAAVLARLTANALHAAGQPIAMDAVLTAFNANETIAQTRQDFAKARRWGVVSFPSLILDVNDTKQSVADGYTNASSVLSKLRELGISPVSAAISH